MLKKPRPQATHKRNPLPNFSTFKYKKNDDKGKEVSQVSQPLIHLWWRGKLLGRKFEEQILSSTSRTEKAAEGPTHKKIHTQNTVKKPGADDVEGTKHRARVAHDER